jgi:hypothetical protein
VDARQRRFDDVAHGLLEDGGERNAVHHESRERILRIEQ